MSTDTPSPLTPKSVWLHKWWLLRVDNDRLAVAGFASGESKGARVFCSAAIAKRHDTTKLETTDGIIVTISNPIDRARSIENGFSPEMCNQFFMGFPYNWKECDIGEGIQTDASCLWNKSDGKGHISPPNYLDDLPATRIRDLVMSPSLVLRKSIFDSILEKGNYQCTGTPLQSTTKGEGTSTTAEATPFKTPVKQKKAEILTVSSNNEIIGAAEDTGLLSSTSSKSRKNAVLSTESRTTRSVTRLESANDNITDEPESYTKKANSSLSTNLRSTKSPFERRITRSTFQSIMSDPGKRITRSQSRKMNVGIRKAVTETLHGSVVRYPMELKRLMD